jgi:2-succinyl-5-enolpyruvyl-6-hydroxy-3-cyclohexene-1-carboxylate synthase
MVLDFRTTNTIWSSVLVETLFRLGLTTAVICPGSRSTPLTIAFARHPQIETIPILDERSAAFFALGVAKKNDLPVALICTSGTAGANFYPAVIEAKESHVPLLILTADRPPELRHCHAGQTIDQIKLYGNYPNWQAELALPASNREMLDYLRQNIVQAWNISLFPLKGVVHLNVPFREPLAPTSEKQEIIEFSAEDFFAGINKDRYSFFSLSGDRLPLDEWQKEERGIIIAGLAQVKNPWQYCQAIAYLSQSLGFPVLAEALSPVRNYAELNLYLISTYDLILRNRQLAEKLNPNIVIQIGELPTSKELREWLIESKSRRWIIDANPDNFDPLHGKTIHLYTSIEKLIELIKPKSNNPNSWYLNRWCELENKVRKQIDLTMRAIDNICEAKVAWLLSQTLPIGTPIFIANSMPVRYAEFFWQPNNNRFIPYFNRGANGIDGTLSTAIGIAHRQQSTVMLTGDLALLHDTNGFLIEQKFSGHLTIILINNNGGGIFEMLPISQLNPPFEEYFATPQNIDFERLCAAYNIEYQLINNWEKLEYLLNPLPEKGIRLLEVRTNRKEDAQWLQQNLSKFASNLQIIEV